MAQRTKKTPQHHPVPPPADPALALRSVRDELHGLPADLERAASSLPSGHPNAAELRDLAATVRTVRIAVARIAIWLEDARREDRHG